MGYLNVNIYADPFYTDALEQRYELAVAEAATADKASQAAALTMAVEQSGQAIINMDFHTVCRMINDKEDYLPYQLAIEAGKGERMSFLLDKDRCVVEAAFYGSAGRQIVYAALALDDEGLTAYGKQTAVLKTPRIAQRTTVFERDTYFLYDDFYAMGWNPKGPELPAGHSATWSGRGQLALCKHVAEMPDDMSEASWAKLLLQPATAGRGDEFIELHIFNKVSPVVLERVVVREVPQKPFHQIQWDILKTEAAQMGIHIAEP